jgi:adenylate cyclase
MLRGIVAPSVQGQSFRGNISTGSFLLEKTVPLLIIGAMNPRIVAVSGPLKGSVFPIPEAGIVIGRKHPENDVTLENDEMVSRRHCRLWLREGRVVVRDLDSRNGTFVNGVSVLEHVFERGDRLKVGSSTFRYLEHDETADPLPVFSEPEPGRTITTFRIDHEQAEAAVSDKATLRAILGITSSINAIRDPDRLQERLLELIFEVLPAKRAAILLVGHKPDAFVSGTYGERGISGEAKFVVSPSVTGQVLSEMVVALINDANPILCVPLSVFDTKLGVIYLEGAETPDGFDHDHVQLLAAIAGIAAVALEHARYVDWLQVENQRLKEDAGIEHGMIGESAKMTDVYRLIRKVAPSDSRVLITGLERHRQGVGGSRHS